MNGKSIARPVINYLVQWNLHPETTHLSKKATLRWVPIELVPVDFDKNTTFPDPEVVIIDTFTVLEPIFPQHYIGHTQDTIINPSWT